MSLLDDLRDYFPLLQGVAGEYAPQLSPYVAGFGGAVGWGGDGGAPVVVAAPPPPLPASEPAPQPAAFPFGIPFSPGVILAAVAGVVVLALALGVRRSR